MSLETNADAPIVVIDDEEDSFALMQHLLRRIGAEEKVAWFGDGESAVGHLRERVSVRRSLPMLLILDLKMPGMDGFEVLQALKGSPELGQVLVVVVSSSSLPEDIARALRLGAFCYFEKYPLPEKFAPIYEIARDRMPLPGKWVDDPCEVALRQIISLVESAISVFHTPRARTDEHDVHVMNMLGGIRRRATGKLLERVNAPVGAKRRWPFGDSGMLRADS